MSSMIQPHLETLSSYITEDNLKEPIQSPKLERYRNNIIFSIGNDSENKIQIGPLQKSMLVEPSYTNNLVSELAINVCNKLTTFITNSNLPIVTYPNMEGFWRHIQIRENLEQEFIITFRLSNLDVYQDLWLVEQERLLDYLTNNFPKLIQVFYQETIGKREPTVNDPIYNILDRKRLEQNMLGITFPIHPLTFFQVNYYSAELMFQKVKDITNGGELLLDLCCGVGIYSQLLGKQFQKVIGIDSNKNNIELAREYNQLDNVEYIAGSVEDYMSECFQEGDVTLIINPCRSGLNRLDLSPYVKLAKQFIYISCNPKSLKRDLDRLDWSNLKVEEIIGINQFPQTKEYEFLINIKNR